MTIIGARMIWEAVRGGDDDGASLEIVGGLVLIGIGVNMLIQAG